MDRRSYPLWLLRDWPAFIGFLVAFWSFIVAGFIAGRRAVRGKRVSERDLKTLFQLYANAESRLDHALWRQAWRACGYAASHAKFELFPTPTNAEELHTRFLAFRSALTRMEHLVVAYADELRQRFNLSRAQVGDPNASIDPLRHAARATSPGYAEGGKTLASLSRFATGGGGMRVLHAHDGGGLAFSARGPPSHLKLFENPTAHTSDAPRLRPRPYAVFSTKTVPAE